MQSVKVSFQEKMRKSLHQPSAKHNLIWIQVQWRIALGLDLSKIYVKLFT